MTSKTTPYDCSETHPGCRELRDESRSQGVHDADNLPFMLCPDAANEAVLLVHGFTASPWEMLLFAQHLAMNNIASLAIRLPGHGTTPEDLAGRRWEEWQEAVRQGYQVLATEFDSIYAAGMSTGSLLSLSVAAQTPFAGLVLFSPYLRVQHWLAPLAGWLRWVRPYQRSSEETQDSHYYNRRPVAGVHQINRLVAHVRKQLPHIDCPVMAFSGGGDQTVDIDSARELVKLLGSRVTIYKRLGADVPHVLTREENPCREEMFTEATQFIQALESTPSHLSR